MVPSLRVHNMLHQGPSLDRFSRVFVEVPSWPVEEIVAGIYDWKEKLEVSVLRGAFVFADDQVDNLRFKFDLSSQTYILVLAKGAFLIARVEVELLAPQQVQS